MTNESLIAYAMNDLRNKAQVLRRLALQDRARRHSTLQQIGRPPRRSKPLQLVAKAPELVHELMQPVTRITDIKVLQLGGLEGLVSNGGNGAPAPRNGSSTPIGEDASGTRDASRRRSASAPRTPAAHAGASTPEAVVPPRP